MSDECIRMTGDYARNVYDVDFTEEEFEYFKNNATEVLKYYIDYTQELYSRELLLQKDTTSYDITLRYNRIDLLHYDSILNYIRLNLECLLSISDLDITVLDIPLEEVSIATQLDVYMLNYYKSNNRLSFAKILIDNNMPIRFTPRTSSILIHDLFLSAIDYISIYDILILNSNTFESVYSTKFGQVNNLYLEIYDNDVLNAKNQDFIRDNLLGCVKEVVIRVRNFDDRLYWISNHLFSNLQTTLIEYIYAGETFKVKDMTGANQIVEKIENWHKTKLDRLK